MLALKPCLVQLYVLVQRRAISLIKDNLIWKLKYNVDSNKILVAFYGTYDTRRWSTTPRGVDLLSQRKRHHTMVCCFGCNTVPFPKEMYVYTISPFWSGVDACWIGISYKSDLLSYRRMVTFLMPIRCSNQIPFLVGLFSSRLIVSNPDTTFAKQGSPTWISVLSSMLM